jgi:poly(beta-D-mannuronate) lyase
MKTGITLVNGVPDSPLNRYFQVKRAAIVFNTLVGNRYSFNIGAGKDAELSLPPLDCVIADNLVWSTVDKLITYTDTPVNMTYEGNIFYGASLGITKPAGITIVNPAMTYGADSLWRIGEGSPAVDAAVGTYDFVTVDIEGQPRTGVFDVGSDELSDALPAQRPVRKTDVGPEYIVTAVPTEQLPAAIPISAGIVRSFPNPFNPRAVVEFSIPVTAAVTVTIYNGIGERIAVLFSGTAAAGRLYRAEFDGTRHPSGLYIAEVSFNNSTLFHKLLLLK